MRPSLNGSPIAHEVWQTEVSAFVAGEAWMAIGDAQVVVHAQVPEVWDASFISRVRPGADVPELIRRASAHLSAHGCGHIRILIDVDAVAREIGSTLVGLGMVRRAYVTMVCEAPPVHDSPRGDVKVAPVSSSAERAVMAGIRELVRSQTPWYVPEVGRALDTWEDIQRASLNLTWLTASFDGSPAGAAGLLMTPHGASLQSIATVPGLRGRGVGSTLVSEVVRRALERGAPRVSLLTDANDKPRRLYRKLGFVEVGRVHEYLQLIR